MWAACPTTSHRVAGTALFSWSTAVSSIYSRAPIFTFQDQIRLRLQGISRFFLPGGWTEGRSEEAGRGVAAVAVEVGNLKSAADLHSQKKEDHHA